MTNLFVQNQFLECNTCLQKISLASTSFHSKFHLFATQNQQKLNVISQCNVRSLHDCQMEERSGPLAVASYTTLRFNRRMVWNRCESQTLIKRIQVKRKKVKGSFCIQVLNFSVTYETCGSLCQRHETENRLSDEVFSIEWIVPFVNSNVWLNLTVEVCKSRSV